MDNRIEIIMEIFNTLESSGVRFYYGDDEIELGEITSMNNYEDGYIMCTLDEDREIKVSIDDFRIYHSKENINLYDWEDVRKFDRAIEEIHEEKL